MSGNFDLHVWQSIKDKSTPRTKNYRGISDATAKKYGVRQEYNEDAQVVAQYYPITLNDELVGVKKRIVLPEKDFRSIGPVNSSCDLFGKYIFNSSPSNSIIIASGELDALSIYQMMADYNESTGKNYENTPVVSAVMGESSSLKQYQNNYEFLNRFEKIFICPDQDTKGQEALHKIAKVLPRDKLFVIDLPLKDANEMLQKDKQKEFVSRFFKARKYSPAGILGSDILYDKILERSLIPKVEFPPFLQGLNNMLAGGIPLGYIVNIMAGSGSGKSTIVNEFILYHLEKQQHKVGVISLEAESGEYGESLLSRKLGKKLSLIADPIEKYNYLSSEEVRKVSDELFKLEDGSPSFYLIDDRGDFNKIEEKIEELIISCSVQIVVIDVLSDIFAGEGLDYQEKFMKWQKSMVKAYPIIFINIIHSRKGASGQQTASNGGMLSEEDMAGSSAQYKSAGINIILQRDKLAPSELERNTMYVHLPKNRSAGVTGLACKLYYENESHTFYNIDEYKALHPELFVEDFK